MYKGTDYTGVAIVYFCHDGQGRFVMSLRSTNTRDEHNRWDIGGGALEFDQKVEDCLRAEIREEYGTEVLKTEFLGFRDVHREGPSHWIALDFKVLVDPALVKNGEPHKFEKVNWFTLDTLPENLHSQLPNFLNIYKPKLLS
ncbi:MAG TPA: NUDIX domain-containing protein [Patescibacteria group bacterium]|nr:NUDIX domain-containing protein [Patescibacteria group bacterium]